MCKHLPLTSQEHKNKHDPVLPVALEHCSVLENTGMHVRWKTGIISFHYNNHILMDLILVLAENAVLLYSCNSIMYVRKVFIGVHYSV